MTEPSYDDLCDGADNDELDEVSPWYDGDAPWDVDELDVLHSIDVL